MLFGKLGEEFDFVVADGEYLVAGLAQLRERFLQLHELRHTGRSPIGGAVEHNNRPPVAAVLPNVHELTMLVRQANSGQGASNRRPGRKVCWWFAPWGIVHRPRGVETEFVVVARVVVGRIGHLASPPLCALHQTGELLEYKLK